MLLASIVSAMVLTSCDGEELAVRQEGQTSEVPADVRQLVQHEVTVSLDGASTRVGYTASGDGLQLSWDKDETLGVYIRKADNSILYAGTMTGSGEAGDRGSRKFSGAVSKKNNGEEYLYLHPAPTGETQGQAAQGKITLTSQSGALGSPAHLNNYIPLVWHETSKLASIHGYAVHVQLTFNEDPGTISKVTLRTMAMPEETCDNVFPKEFSIAQVVSDAPVADQCTGSIELTLSPGTKATQVGNQWKADAYLASAFATTNVFRTKYHAEVTTESDDTFYTDYISFPGQQSSNGNTLAMLGNGKVYNLTAPASKDAAMTIISDTYRVNSLLGMWDQYGKAYDPLRLIVYQGGDATLPADILPAQLTDNKSAICSRYKNNGSGTPTWLGAGSGSLYNLTATAISDTKQSDVTINNIEITAPTEVFVTFISEYGWNENLLGYYHYAGTAPESSRDITKTLIFPNVSKPDHQPFNLGGSGAGSTASGPNIGKPEQAPLREFETVKLLYTDPKTGFTSTIFPTGTIIGFIMMIDTEAQEQTPNAGYNLLKWSQWRLFTNTKWNKENTIANGAASNWRETYAHDNFFCSGDVCKDGSPIPGLAVYGVKDDGTNTANTAYGAMIFMVSTSNRAAMQTQNKAYFNIGTGDQVIAK